MSLRRFVFLAFLALAGCATAPPRRGMLPMAALPGWAAEDHAAAYALVREVCADLRLTQPPPPPAPCPAALAHPVLGEKDARKFLESHYRAEPSAAAGVLTAYFFPTYPARRTPEGAFTAPVRPLPADPLAAGPRAAIEASPPGAALAWIRPEDLFFLQIQGSGRLIFPDRQGIRAVFAGSNGRPFTPIAAGLATGGANPQADASADGVHAWLAAHRGPEAERVMDRDERYVFFRLVPDAGGEPSGAAGAPLLAGRSVAVDPTAHAFFELLWLDADKPLLAGAKPAYRRLATALDVGAAITGQGRADLYLGQGDAAGLEAGRVRHRLHLYRIVPAQDRR